MPGRGNVRAGTPPPRLHPGLPVGRHHPGPHPPGHALHEPFKAWVVPEPEERGLRAGTPQPVELGHRDPDGFGVRRASRTTAHRPEADGRGFAVGHQQEDRLHRRMAAEEAAGQQQAVMEVGSLFPPGRQGRQLADVHGLRVAPERDQLQPVPAEPRGDEVVQGQRGALHRHPAPLGGHGEGHVNEQDDGGLGTGLSFAHFDVGCGEVQPLGRVAAAGHGAADRVGHGARDVPGLGVPELPLAARTGLLAGGAGDARVPPPLPARQLLGGVPQQGPAELPHGLRATAAGRRRFPAAGSRRPAWPVQFQPGCGGHGGVLPELAGEGIQVQVIEG
jgi:hypothetical protein